MAFGWECGVEGDVASRAKRSEERRRSVGGEGFAVGPGLKGTHKVFADLALGHCVNIFQ